MNKLSEDQLTRYSRNILIKEIGIDGQAKLGKGKVLVIGAGGLGSPALLYCAAAGIGTLGIVDNDCVELSNLQRQIIHRTDDIGTAKTTSAALKIHELNPDIIIETHQLRLSVSNVRSLIQGYDFVIDATDNFAAKFLINDACVMENIAYSHGGVLAFSGQTMTVIPQISACYRCVFTAPPIEGSVPTSAQVGIMGSIPGILGSIQATEAIKYIAQAGEMLTDKLLTFDTLTMDFRTITLRKNPHCPLCAEQPTIHTLSDSH